MLDFLDNVGTTEWLLLDLLPALLWLLLISAVFYESLKKYNKKHNAENKKLLKQMNDNILNLNKKMEELEKELIRTNQSFFVRDSFSSNTNAVEGLEQLNNKLKKIEKDNEEINNRMAIFESQKDSIDSDEPIIVENYKE